MHRASINSSTILARKKAVIVSSVLRIPAPVIPKLLSIIKSFHDGMMGTVQNDGSTSDVFSIKSGVNQGCVLASTLFGTFFALLLKHAFKSSREGIYLHTRSDGKLYQNQRSADQRYALRR